jgi:hypothetical protein
MKIAAIYFGSLKSSFALAQDWSKFDLGIFASDSLDALQNARESGTRVFSYTHRTDAHQIDRLDSGLNDGLFLDWATAPNQYIDSLVTRLHDKQKSLIVNTGWGAHTRSDYGHADILLFESFLGTNSGDNGKWPVDYSKTDEHADIKKLRILKQKGYKLITLTYGPSCDRVFALDCHEKARIHGSDYFIYTQAPGWEKEGSGFQIFTFENCLG